MLTHHAYYIEDSLAQFDAYMQAIHASEGYEASDPNFVTRQYEKFGIDEARALIEHGALRNTGSRALFLVATSSITSEAQQALLKLLEEPQQGTIFVLLVPHGILLPTLKSRCMQLPLEVAPSASTENIAREFLSWPYKKRSDWITATLKNPPAGGEDDSREYVRAFLNDLEAELYKKIGDGKEIRESLQEIAHFRQYLGDRSPSLKMILEHFAATLPLLR